MSQMELSPRDRRTLVVGATVLLPLILAGKVLPAAFDWQRRRLQEATLVLAKAGEAHASRLSFPALRDTLIARRARLARLDSLLLGGASLYSAAAELASVVGALADSAAIKVGSLQLRTDSAAHVKIATVSVRLSGLSDVAGLTAFLRAVEGGARPLIVRELLVVPADPGAPDAKPEVLRIDAVVEGLARVVTETKR